MRKVRVKLHFPFDPNVESYLFANDVYITEPVAEYGAEEVWVETDKTNEELVGIMDIKSVEESIDISPVRDETKPQRIGKPYSVSVDELMSFVGGLKNITDDEFAKSRLEAVEDYVFVHNDIIPNTKKYIVYYFNRFANETQLFYIIAKDEEDAERLFWLKHDKEIYHDCIERICKYYEPKFYTEEMLKSL